MQKLMKPTASSCARSGDRHNQCWIVCLVRDRHNQTLWSYRRPRRVRDL